jgi:hypothetical protein
MASLDSAERNRLTVSIIKQAAALDDLEEFANVGRLGRAVAGGPIPLLNIPYPGETTRQTLPRFFLVFKDEVNTVRRVRNSLVHALPVSDNSLADTAEIGGHLIDILRRGISDLEEASMAVENVDLTPTWPRDRYTGPGGGLYTGSGGGLYNGPGGGAYTGPGGGLYTGPGGGLYTGPGGGLYSGPGGGLYTGPGGGLYTGPGGGLYSGPGGGLYAGPGGGLYAGACAEPYRRNIPPLDVFVQELRKRNLGALADLLAR